MKILLIIVQVILGIFIASTICNFGTFIIAKTLRKNVKSYSIGIGHSLIDKNIGDMRFRINIFPFGGYVELDSFENPNKLTILFSNLLIYFSGILAALIFGTILLGSLLYVGEGNFLINAFCNEIKNILFSIYQVLFEGHSIRGCIENIYNNCLNNNFIITILYTANYILALDVIIYMIPLPFLTCGKMIKEIIKYIKSEKCAI